MFNLRLCALQKYGNKHINMSFNPKSLSATCCISHSLISLDCSDAVSDDWDKPVTAAINSEATSSSESSAGSTSTATYRSRGCFLQEVLSARFRLLRCSCTRSTVPVWTSGTAVPTAIFAVMMSQYARPTLIIIIRRRKPISIASWCPTIQRRWTGLELF